MGARGEPRGNYNGGRGRAANFEGSTFSEFGALIRQRRLELNLTMAALAKRAELDHTYISRIERGERPPPAPWVTDKLVAALEFPPGRALRVYWAASIVPPFFRDPQVEEAVFEALKSIAEADNPMRAVALLRLAAAGSAVLETMDTRRVTIEPDLLLRALARG